MQADLNISTKTSHRSRSFPSSLSLSLSHSCWLPHCFLGRYFAWIWVEFQWHFPKQRRSPLRNPDFTSGATGCSSWDHLTPLHLKSALQPRSIKILRFFTYQDEPEKRSVSSCLMQGKKSPRSIKIPAFQWLHPEAAFRRAAASAWHSLRSWNLG